MQSSDFTAECPGRLVPTDREALAFVPAPPPGRFDLDARTITLLTQAERRLGQLTGIMRAARVNAHLFARPLMRREAISSSRIEGTITTPEQLLLLEAEEDDEAPTSGASQTQEVLNYVRALHKGLALLDRLPVCVRLIQELHATLMDGVRGADETPGELRTIQNFIGTSRDIHQARFVPPPASELRACLDTLEHYMNPAPDDEGVPVLVRLAVIHYQFETIHPFRDGNGRVGRLLIPIILRAYGKLDEPALYLSPYFERHRPEYVDLLLRVSQTGDFTSWIRFFLTAVAEGASDTVNRAEALLALRDRYHTQLASARSSALLLKLVDRLFDRPVVTIGNAARILGVTPAAASANLQKLVKAGVLTEITGRRRDQRFLAREILRVAHDE